MPATPPPSSRLPAVGGAREDVLWKALISQYTLPEFSHEMILSGRPREFIGEFIGFAGKKPNVTVRYTCIVKKALNAYKYIYVDAVWYTNVNIYMHEYIYIYK